HRGVVAGGRARDGGLELPDVPGLPEDDGRRAGCDRRAGVEAQRRADGAVRRALGVGPAQRAVVREELPLGGVWVQRVVDGRAQLGQLGELLGEDADGLPDGLVGGRVEATVHVGQEARDEVRDFVLHRRRDVARVREEGSRHYAVPVGCVVMMNGFPTPPVSVAPSFVCAWMVATSVRARGVKSSWMLETLATPGADRQTLRKMFPMRLSLGLLIITYWK